MHAGKPVARQGAHLNLAQALSRIVGTLQKAAKTAAVLLLLTLLLPVNAAFVMCALGWQCANRLLRRGPKRIVAQNAKSVLISGGKMTKALQLARLFHQAGHRVVLTESHDYWLVGHRFSRSVDRFYTLPKAGSASYAAALLALVKRENIDLYVPVCSPAASWHDSLAVPLLAPHCEVLHVQPDTILQLDDKFQFFQAAQRLQLRVPKSFLITDPEQVVAFDFSGEVRSYILKSIAYDPIRRLDLTQLPGNNAAAIAAMATFVRSLPISQNNPWILQEFIVGQEFCTHGTFRAGELMVHCCCESSAFQVNYQNVNQPEIQAWVARFGVGMGLTGQASFDFIQAQDDGQIYAIECNPRTHSAITMFYRQPEVADAYLGHQRHLLPVLPAPGNRPTYWIYQELWRLLCSLHSPQLISARLAILFGGTDAVFEWRDPAPFLMLHHWHIPLLLLRDLRQNKGWLKIDFNIGKLVQAGGD